MPIIMQAEGVETQDGCHEDVPILVKAEEVVTGSRLWSLSFAKRIMDFIVSLVALVAALVPGIIIYVLVRGIAGGSSRSTSFAPWKSHKREADRA
jgi:lipopolysaccharide/colanic/teichoic acid biosynthesis glycosyltransferase